MYDLLERFAVSSNVGKAPYHSLGRPRFMPHGVHESYPMVCLCAVALICAGLLVPELYLGPTDPPQRASTRTLAEPSEYPARVSM